MNMRMRMASPHVLNPVVLAGPHIKVIVAILSTPDTARTGRVLATASGQRWTGKCGIYRVFYFRHYVCWDLSNHGLEGYPLFWSKETANLINPT